MVELVIGKDKDRLWCILSDEASFYMGGFKALMNVPEDSGIVPCMKSYDNGKIKLSYDISGYHPLNEVLHSITRDGLISVIRSVTESVITINDNPFMKLECTRLNREEIFVSGSQKEGYRTKIIYIPVNSDSPAGSREPVDRYYRFLSELLRECGAQQIHPELQNVYDWLVKYNDKSLESLRVLLDEHEDGQPRGGQVDVGSGGNGRADGYDDHYKDSDDPNNRASGGGYNSGNGGKRVVGKGEIYHGNSGGGSQPRYESADDDDLYGKKGKEVYGKKKQSESDDQINRPKDKRKQTIIIIAAVAVVMAAACFFLVNWIGSVAVIAAAAVVIVCILGKDRDEVKKKKKSAPVRPTPEKHEDQQDAGTTILFNPIMKLETTVSSVVFKLEINKEVFVIGRSSECDGVIAFNGAIGRNHCRIITRHGEAFVIDNDSKNGTKINGKLLKPQQEYRLQINDTLQLADLRFRVEAI